ncbi:hypothetical protein BD414DRAFT_67264 [Trametes punicea]|nr:hypothetical protein BD414DRAFT_67264 [Trametes punicea]
MLPAYNRNVLHHASRAVGVSAEGAQDATHSLIAIARRVQLDLKRVTGRFVPIYQVVTSIHALKRSGFPTRSGSNSPPAPTPLQILITPTSPAPLPSTSGTPSSMSRRRLACNIPALQSHLSIPAPAFPPSFSSPLALPASPLRNPRLFTLSRRSSLSSGDSTQCPVTPIDQIVHTPLTPPKIPRVPPPPPRTWARLNAQMHGNDISPLASPGVSFTPYVLSPSHSGRPMLDPLRIPVTCTLAAGDAELRDNHLSPRPLSPFEPARSPLGYGPSMISAAQYRPAPVRNNSASMLTRAALLRASRPQMARSLSVSEYVPPEAISDSAIFPLVCDAPSSPVALASPFIIRSEEMDTEYFRF